MGCSGYIDWHRLDCSLPWVRHRLGEQTFVYAFWLVDYGRSQRDRGVTVLKDDGAHPDWYLHAEVADRVLTAYAPPRSTGSPNVLSVFDQSLTAKPLLAAALLGSADAVYKRNDGYWWAAKDDLTRRGRKLLKDLDRLYEREAHLITFIDKLTDESVGPRDSR